MPAGLIDRTKAAYGMFPQAYHVLRDMYRQDYPSVMQGLAGLKKNLNVANGVQDYLQSSEGEYPSDAANMQPKQQKLVPAQQHKLAGAVVNPVGLNGIRRPQADYEQIEYPLHGVGGR